ncbi:bifunctional ADP-dependent NAD(P)H-hydrate dehydratase/NAD(P)H-hydrate epimerase [Bifidobacterium gallicum]|uniref:ADP-dependent (S)-NAD(P)H-hydrate dehydratase n=1 Tax=Bifidobacterium gallicum DSM 20093 = LMG 11596 TaxID=561180 RepID=D1NSI5_9BIFI|nr:bifunctional ADP-dependent NAD(P)H-hydrate dehydratase/NAD(P)H-hydrate epimerase [Bifidobacterium gallicum]EFA23637.1 putative YjeF domain protein [Bifidobacterium gallicum DSM 20093 = LMG 11596]KFI58698.1 carbohydrate kinase [Bifidobacterium gallicum DSM 20093 = LMG 11596]
MDEHLESTHLHTLVHGAYDVATVRAMEQPLLRQGVPLMQSAAAAVAQNVRHMLDTLQLVPEATRIALLAGAGDNGGDGLYAGAVLAHHGYHVTAIAVGRSLHREAYQAFIQSGGHIWTLDPDNHIPGSPAGFSAGEAGERLERAISFCHNAHVLIDAMTGIGLSGPLHGIPAAMAQALGVECGAPDRPATAVRNDIDGMAQHYPIVIAVDTPSGVGVDDGNLDGPYIPADLTVMFGAMKPCAMLPPASYACGTVSLVDFGFDLDNATALVTMTSADDAAACIRPVRLSDAKYARGVVGLITGSQRYPGAAVLSASGAARSNIGMVRYMGPTRAQDLVLHTLAEATIGKGHVQSWVVGSGVPGAHDAGADEDMQREAIAALLAHYALDAQQSSSISEPTMQAAVSDSTSLSQAELMPPIVVDAGALDMLPTHVGPQVVLTPHAGELARLLTRLGHDVTEQQVQQAPLRHARIAADLTGATVLIKGAITLVVQPGTPRVVAAGRAPAQLATAGAGDVLGGVIAALLAQQADIIDYNPTAICEVVAAGAYVHGLAAALAADAQQRGWMRPSLFGLEDFEEAPVDCGHPIVATDVVDALPQAFSRLC